MTRLRAPGMPVLVALCIVDTGGAPPAPVSQP
jgi:hypothetical protein